MYGRVAQVRSITSVNYIESLLTIGMSHDATFAWTGKTYLINYQVGGPKSGPPGTTSVTPLFIAGF